MFGLFKSKKETVKPYHPEKDSAREGYQRGIAHLAANTNMEWLLQNKMNAEISLCSLDIGETSSKAEEPGARRLRLMIGNMTDAEYADWVTNVVFH